MKPLKIVAKLSNSIVSDGGFIPLDGALMKVALRREHGDGLPDPNEKLVYPTNFPIEKRGEGENWYYACSFAKYSQIAEYTQFWHKRFDSVHERHITFKGRRGRVDIQRGRYKGYRIPLQSRLIDKITWYAFGCRDGVADLLCGIHFLGKKRAQGNGKVLNWTVEEVSEDRSDERAIPSDAKEMLEGGLKLTFKSFRPPYWHRDNFAWCR